MCFGWYSQEWLRLEGFAHFQKSAFILPLFQREATFGQLLSWRFVALELWLWTCSLFCSFISNWCCFVLNRRQKTKKKHKTTNKSKISWIFIYILYSVQKKQCAKLPRNNVARKIVPECANYRDFCLVLEGRNFSEKVKIINPYRFWNLPLSTDRPETQIGWVFWAF